MARRESMEERAARFNRMRQAADLDAGSLDELRRGLAGRHAFLAAAAAKAAARCDAAQLVPEIAAMFERFMAAPADRDKGCRARQAAVEVLSELGHRDAAVFLRGARCVQMEPVYGGRADSAGGLRAACALALVRVGSPDAAYVLADLLTDPEAEPRRAAIAALRFLGSREGELLLRLKARAGDPDPAVLGECFSALLEAAPARSVDLVGEMLDDEDPAVAEEAALALGESRAEGVLELLVEKWHEDRTEVTRRMLLLPMALTRADEAFEFLLRVLRKELEGLAAAALEALKVFDDRGERRRKIRKTVAERRSRRLSRALMEWCG